MFTKQVSRPVDAWIPIMAIEAEQVERTQRKNLVMGPVRGFCAHTGFYRTYFQRPSVLDPTQG
jgi:hypothetical protein